MRLHQYATPLVLRALLCAGALVGTSALVFSTTAMAESADGKPQSSIPPGVGLSMHKAVNEREAPLAGDDGATSGLRSWGKFRAQQAAAKKAQSDSMSGGQAQ